MNDDKTTTIVTTNLVRVEVKFNGCFCDVDCDCLDEPCAECNLVVDDTNFANWRSQPSKEVGYFMMDLGEDDPAIWVDEQIAEAYIRTRDCCRKFGFGDSTGI